MPLIPKILHYCFGFDADFGGKPWSLVHFVCLKSAIQRIEPDQIFFYYDYEPHGEWWEETRKLVNLIKVHAPRDIFGNALNHPAHRADVVRLEKLIQHGGIYLDADVFVQHSFDSLLDNSVVLGQEGIGAEFGLGNAVILAEPGAPFLMKWYEEYRWFRSNGYDQHWNEHSIRVPLILAKAHPSELTILPHTAFYSPLWTPKEIELIFGSPPSLGVEGAFANHLWESAAWKSYLEQLTPGKVRSSDSNFHHWARPFVENFPDEYGKLSLSTKIARWLERLRRNLRLVHLKFKRPANLLRRFS